MHQQNYTKIYKITPLDDESVNRAPAGSGRASVASGTGAEARAGAVCVGVALVASGWSRRWPRARARAAGRRGGAGGRREALGRRRWLVDGHGGSFAATAAGGHASGRERMKRCGPMASVKFIYFRRPTRRPSGISSRWRLDIREPSGFYCFTVVIKHGYLDCCNCNL